MKTSLTLILSLFVVNAFCQVSAQRYELVKMDKTVNTFRHEAAPVISPDGSTLYFFVMTVGGKDDTQMLWMSKKDENGKWGQAQELSSPFNIHPYNQVFTVFEDGSLFIKGGRAKGEKGFSIVRGGSLDELRVKDFKSMNNGRFYGASMSADKKHMIIYFSEKDGSIASDLYVSHAQPDGSWTRPQQLKISSPQDDVGPFIAPDQKTLYFASARIAPGRQGQTDIYKTTRLDDTWTNWSTPVNIGKPINTSGEDFYFTVDNAGNVITSRANKAIEGAQLDLYVLMPKTLKIKLDGFVFNQKTNDPLTADVEIRLKDKEPIKAKTANGRFESTLPEVTEYTISATASGFLSKQETFKVPAINGDTTLNVELALTPVAKQLMVTGRTFDAKTEKMIDTKLTITPKADRRNSSSFTTAEGRFEQRVPKLGWYMITAAAEGYMNATDSISVSDEDLSPFSKDIYLQPIEVGLTVRLKNIYFAFDKTDLKKESYPELNKVVDFLKSNPSVEIEIAGHTDSKGSDDYNLNLSQGRCQSVVNYLISQGIDSNRLTPHGYGESKPIDTNDTEAGQANNRRVEFTVVKK